MKTLIASIILCVAALSAQAGVTNIIVDITFVDTGVSTNTAKITWTGDGSKKDINRVNGVVQGYNEYRAAGLGTNMPSGWFKDAIILVADKYAADKAVKDNAALAAKIAAILTAQPDLLSTAQKNQLDAIGLLLP